ncbi:hypothetical protein HPB47_009179 [Ixodes persulcatus]|uniref:Uncharacterized protein n=1 Tax=Ixodes persulcatus TaxID=34615 RepID=A0AC60P2R5_IXOPE|nr:hypothetical protein HPB47_009179 [Ixodes persulcatus]
MLMTRIEESYNQMKTRLRKAFDEVPYVTVAADCWTSFRRFGHLQDDQELLLASVVLRRFKVGGVHGDARRQELTQLLKVEDIILDDVIEVVLEVALDILLDVVFDIVLDDVKDGV